MGSKYQVARAGRVIQIPTRDAQEGGGRYRKGAVLVSGWPLIGRRNEPERVHQALHSGPAHRGR